jgi:hypothetical protein
MWERFNSNSASLINLENRPTCSPEKANNDDSLNTGKEARRPENLYETPKQDQSLQTRQVQAK